MGMKARAPAVWGSAKTGGTDDWQTPWSVIERVRRIGPIGLDPCTARTNPTRARLFFTEKDDAFAQPDWAGLMKPGEVAFANPPYSKMDSTVSVPGWADLLASHAERLELITLCAARVDAGWFHRLGWQSASAICFIRGRLRFIDPATGEPAMSWSKKEKVWKATGAGFPSAAIYHGPRPWLFESAYADFGAVVRL